MLDFKQCRNSKTSDCRVSVKFLKCWCVWAECEAELKWSNQDQSDQKSSVLFRTVLCRRIEGDRRGDSSLFKTSLFYISMLPLKPLTMLWDAIFPVSYRLFYTQNNKLLLSGRVTNKTPPSSQPLGFTSSLSVPIPVHSPQHQLSSTRGATRAAAHPSPPTV